MADYNPAEITSLLAEIAAGDSVAESKLIELTYDELRRIARGLMKWEANNTLQATAVVHEAYERLKKDEAFRKSPNRRYLYASATQAMRRILVDAARKRKAQKHGGDFVRHPLGHDLDFYEARSIDLVALDEALIELEELSRDQVKVVQLRWLSGMTVKEVADLLKVSEWKVENDWRLARAFLYKRLAVED